LAKVARFTVAVSAGLPVHSVGGNRRGTGRQYANLLATMLLGGLWHGAAWTFVLWGGLHGVYLALNPMIRRLSERLAVRVPA
jgi:alginate O-acetyltransferase complex protein AlgI